jgi:hypothetical protein
MNPTTITRNLRGLKRKRPRLAAYAVILAALGAFGAYCIAGAVNDALAQQAEFERVNR